MSAGFRQKLIDELSANTSSPYAQMISMFDHGEVEIRRYDWASTYNNALLNVFKANQVGLTAEYEPDNFLDSDWSAFIRGIEKRLRNRGGIIWLHNGTSAIPPQKTVVTNLKATFAFMRGSSASGVNIDQQAENAMKEATVDYFKNAQIFSQVQNVVQSQVYEHGKKSENLMSDDNPRVSSRYGPGSQTAMEDAMARGTTASGAAGTKTSNRLLGALQKELRRAYSRERWFGVVHSLIKAKWADLFGFDSTLVSADSDAKAAVKDELTLRAGMVPNLANITHNPGTFDRALRRHLRKFLSDQDFFKNEIMKLVMKGKANPNVLNNIDGLFSASATPKQRMEKAGVKLAAAGILDQLSKEVVKKTSAGKNANKHKAKKGTSNSTGRSKKGTKSTRRRNSAVTRKKGTRGQQNAIQQNPIALKELINAKLPDELLKQMQLPKLRNRTGRFRNSAQVTNVMVGPRGGTHIEYTYMKNPYQTFEPGGRQGSVNRDPRRLIGGTVREIAQEIMGQRFIKVRSV